MPTYGKTSTGNTYLDQVISSLRSGDNVVWQVNELADYAAFAHAFVAESIRNGKRVVYMRFADHPAIIGDDGVKTYKLNAARGFESFTTQVHRIIEREGLGVHYVFDSLSHLLREWATDLMVGNFFKVTCPYLFELDTVAYFALLRNAHSFETIARIRETTQLLLDMYNIEGRRYIHPLKVWNRYSPTMFLPHSVKDDAILPITSSSEAAALFSHLPGAGLSKAERNIDYWDRLFWEAERLLQEKHTERQEKQMLSKLCSLILSKDDTVLAIAREHFSLQDIIAMKSRLVGSGCIGGKAVGMLLARKILMQDDPEYWREHMEPHDSFYIGSDVFYTYIVQNGWWQQRLMQKSDDNFFEAAGELRENMLRGQFPHDIREQFMQMLEYFGQSPVIVRSSSLLEDSFHSAFAGKYESVFCVNQGSPAERYAEFENALKTVYASAMSEDALVYRKKRGLHKNDEQMAALVQRVSGEHRGKYFFPLLGGVGFSYNSYVWNKEINPEAGMARIVFGLGTRAVNRTEGDYPRIVSLDNPMLQPFESQDDQKKYSQHTVDVLDLHSNTFVSLPLHRLAAEDTGIDMRLLGRLDHEVNKRLRELDIQGREAWLLTFESIFGMGLIEKIKRLLQTIQNVYRFPVDVEFTVNQKADGALTVNLLQCRPLQTRGETAKTAIPEDIAPQDMFISTNGKFMGGNACLSISRIVYIDPEGYTHLPEAAKCAVARLVGDINRKSAGEDCVAMLMAPGRIGSSTPSLGVPVSFSEINNFAVLCEMNCPEMGMAPELSFGSHFFQDLVEADIFYMALFINEPDTVWNETLVLECHNSLETIAPLAGALGGIVRVIETPGRIRLISDIDTQKLVLFRLKG
jgi:hypothetical protein